MQALNYHIRFIRPSDNLEPLNESLQKINKVRPFSGIIDLTHGKMIKHLHNAGFPTDIKTTRSLSLSRLRQADKPGLPTTGHLITHNREELVWATEKLDTSHVLVLDDTAFSGTTSLLLEKQVRSARPERTINFTHGFLILNEGTLGERPGAKQRIASVGSTAVGGMMMQTPIHDGWHFFDMIDQANFEEHITLAIEVASDPSRKLSASEKSVLFPNTLPADVLKDIEKRGWFITDKPIEGGLSVCNPQLLPSIVEAGHILHPNEWKISKKEAIQNLISLHTLLGGHHA